MSWSWRDFFPRQVQATITPKKIHQIMYQQGWIDTDAPPIWFVLDSKFILAAESEIKAIINKDQTDKKVYVPESGDCDNYAFELRHAFGRKGWAVGMIAVDTGTPPLHAIFFYITNTHKLVAVEPQTDSVFDKKFKLVAVEMH